MMRFFSQQPPSSEPSRFGSPRQNRSLVVAGAVVCIVAVPFLFGGEDEETAEDRRAKIASMPAAERARLERNFETFQRLSTSERDAYRRLHQELEQDADQGGTLKQTAAAYHEWVKTLSPWQREELRKETDPNARLQLVREFQISQQAQHDDKRLLPHLFGRRFGRLPSFGPRLSDEDWDAVLVVIEQSLEVEPDRKARLEGLSGFNRQLKTLSEALRNSDVSRSQNDPRPNEDRRSDGGPRGNGPPPPPWPDATLTEQLISAISDDRLRERLQSMSRLEPRQQYLNRLIATTLTDHVKRQMVQFQPSDEQLAELFVELETRIRDEIMRLPPDDAQRRILGLYLARHRDELPVDFNEYRRVMQRLLSGGGRQSGPRMRYSGDHQGRGRSRSERDGGRERGRAPGNGNRAPNRRPSERDRQSDIPDSPVNAPRPR